MSMNENTESTEVKAERTLANIVRGQIPHALVYMIRFQETGNKEGEIARRYGTTGGKVADIVKGRNFGYIDAAFVPTQEQKDAAVAWLKQVPDYDTNGTDEVVTAVEGLNTATAEEAEAFLAKRSGSRKSAPKEPAADGDTPQAPKPARRAKAKVEATPADADSLLS
jgi:hypothetical protein